MKQIRIFTNGSMFDLSEEVNDFIKNNKMEIQDIQYSTTSSGWFIATTQQHSAMVVWEEK